MWVRHPCHPDVASATASRSTATRNRTGAISRFQGVPPGVGGGSLERTPGCAVSRAGQEQQQCQFGEFDGPEPGRRCRPRAHAVATGSGAGLQESQAPGLRRVNGSIGSPLRPRPAPPRCRARRSPWRASTRPIAKNGIGCEHGPAPGPARLRHQAERERTRDAGELLAHRVEPEHRRRASAGRVRRRSSATAPACRPAPSRPSSRAPEVARPRHEVAEHADPDVAESRR